MDVFTQENLAIEVGQELKGDDVSKVLNAIRQKLGVPKLLFCDNGSGSPAKSWICGPTTTGCRSTSRVPERPPTPGAR
jgi:hypothetical protein